MTRKGKALREAMLELPTASTLMVVDREDVCGFIVSWSERGFGYGQLEFVLDKRTGEGSAHTETMSPERVGQIIQRLVGTTVKEGLS